MNPDPNAVVAARGEMHDVFGPMSLRRIEALIDAKVRAIVAEEFAAYRAAVVAAGGRDPYAETVPVEQLKDVAVTIRESQRQEAKQYEVRQKLLGESPGAAEPQAPQMMQRNSEPEHEGVHAVNQNCWAYRCEPRTDGRCGHRRSKHRLIGTRVKDGEQTWKCDECGFYWKAPVSCDGHFKAEGFCTNCGGFTKAIPSVKDVAVTDGETRPSSRHPVSSTAPAGDGNERGTMKEGEAVKPKGGKQICEASPTNPDPESQSDEQWDDNAPYCTRGEHHAGLHSWEVSA